MDTGSKEATSVLDALDADSPQVPQGAFCKIIII